MSSNIVTSCVIPSVSEGSSAVSTMLDAEDPSSQVPRDDVPGKLPNIQQVVLRFLARREYAALELKHRLLKRGYPTDLVHQVLAEFQAKGYQSDERFAGQCYRTCIAKGYGVLKIEQLFKQHGLPSELLRTLMSQESIDWCQRAQELLEKNTWRFRACVGNSKPGRFLLARGFSGDVVRQALNAWSCRRTETGLIEHDENS